MSAAVQTLEAGLVLAVERIAKLEAPASNVVDLVADFFGRPPAHLNPKLITDEISSKIIRQMLKDKNYELLHRPGVLTSVHKAAILFTDKGADEITFKSKGEEAERHVERRPLQAPRQLQGLAHQHERRSHIG